MKANGEKPTDNVATIAKPANGSPLSTHKTAEKEAATAQKQTIEKILNDLDILQNRKEIRENLLESRKKLKSFNPTVTESNCTLSIVDNKGNQFRTTHTEALKMIIGNYVSLVERKLEEVETDISNMASKLSA